MGSKFTEKLKLDVGYKNTLGNSGNSFTTKFDTIDPNLSLIFSHVLDVLDLQCHAVSVVIIARETQAD